MARINDNLRKFREAGALEGSLKAGRLAAREAKARARAVSLARRPLSVEPEELRAALGGEDPVIVLRGRVLDALPSLAAWEASLGELDDAGRRELLARADRIAAHEFDLLGSGPTELGAEIDWSRDFKSGRSWPAHHISRFRTVFDDDSDVKVPWELSRCQHLPLLAAAWRLDGEERHLEEIGAQLDSWIKANPVEIGPNWGCTMDVAIRAANWVAALAICAEGASGLPWFDRALGSLLLHGRFIAAHPEYGEVRGNHYLSDVVGLLVVAALFAGGEEGRGWLRWGAEELEAEMLHQVHPDGIDHEASVPYHRLVAELFAAGGGVVGALVPERPSAGFEERLAAMADFTADYTRPDGLAPQIGDADDGRFLPLGDYGAVDHRDHSHLLRDIGGRSPEAGARSISRPDGGFHVLRSGELYAIFRAGDTGMRGIGGHSHNDQLSFELAAGGRALIADPGSYLYTAAPAERNRFRSTAFHSTLGIDGAEQNELAGDYLFSLLDRTRTELLGFEAGETPSVSARHHGYEHLAEPAVHTRTLSLDGAAGSVLIEDEVDSTGAHELEWTFPLAGGEPGVDRGWCLLVIAGVELAIRAPEGVELSLRDGWLSPSYGVREPARFLVGRAASPAGVSHWRWELSVSAG